LAVLAVAAIGCDKLRAVSWGSRPDNVEDVCSIKKIVQMLMQYWSKALSCLLIEKDEQNAGLKCF